MPFRMLRHGTKMGARPRPPSVIIATMKRRTFLRHSAALAALPLVRGTSGGASLLAAPAAPLRDNGARLKGWLAKFGWMATARW